MTSLARKNWVGPVIASLLLSAPGLAAAEDHSAKIEASKAAAPQSKPAAAPVAPPEKKKSYYVKTRSYRLEPEPDLRNYVRNASKTYEQLRAIDWLNIGLDTRVRYEYRQNDYRPWTDTSSGTPVQKIRPFPDALWLQRTRAYFGVEKIFDPLRFAVEFQDSRSYNGLYEPSVQDVDQHELLQGYAELYFKDALGKDPLGNDRPLSLRAGRMHLELLDRRLIANNEFRNTTNNFEGFRVKLGTRDNDWDIDVFALQPVLRFKHEFDHSDRRTWIYGGVLSVRRWSDIITMQPYFLGRMQSSDPTNIVQASRVHREVYAPGLRFYGVVPGTNFDFDFDINKQFGYQGEFRALGRRQTIQTAVQNDAIAYAFEGGYTFDHPWKPRVSAVYGYGTGDKNRNDSANQRFDPLFGFNQPWSRNDYFSWDNIRTPKARLEFSPHKDIQIDTAYNAFWLASATDAWNRANLRDPNGASGTFLGHEFDIRYRQKMGQFANLTLSYARFWPGTFTKSFAAQTGGLTAKPSNFIYFEFSVNAFGDGNVK